MSDAASASEPPFLRVVRGDPTPVELAALVVVVAARQAAASDPLAQDVRSAWGDPALAVRRVLHPGPGGWRRSALAR